MYVYSRNIIKTGIGILTTKGADYQRLF